MDHVRSLQMAVVVVACISATVAGVAAQSPSRPQCTCEPGADPNNGGRFLSGITNGALCVMTPGGDQPVCSIQVYCLSDGTGSGCPAHDEGIEEAERVAEGGEIDLAAFVDALRQGISSGAEAANIELDFDLDRTLTNIVEGQETLTPCFEAFGDTGEEPVSATGELVACSYSPFFGSLTISRGTDDPKGIAAIQLIRRQ